MHPRDVREPVLWVNKGEGTVKLAAWNHPGSFGAGNYKQRQQDELYDKEKEVLFQPLHSSLVLFNGHLATVEALVNQRLTQFPSTKVMYHDMIPAPTADRPHAWQLKRTSSSQLGKQQSRTARLETQSSKPWQLCCRYLPGVVPAVRRRWSLEFAGRLAA